MSPVDGKQLLGVTKKRVALPVAETVAEAFLMHLWDRGVRNYFVNAGTDFAPLVEAYARLHDFVDQLPRPVVAAHENLAMGMAHGAYLMSGDVQAVMFHVGVGTANAVCAALNASYERIPILIAAGRTPVLEGGALGARNTRVAWAQEMFDQSSLMREAVKWDYELRDRRQLDSVLDRALTRATSSPKGPVYLTLPRELLSETISSSDRVPRSMISSVSKEYPDPVAIEKIASRLSSARLPVISSLASGADPETVGLLAELCEKFAIGYVEEQARYLNFPSDHPLHLGYSMQPIMEQSDALCFIESDVPWIPDWCEPDEEAFIAQCGIDPEFSKYPMRSHRSDIMLKGDPVEILRGLKSALELKVEEIPKSRRSKIENLATEQRSIREVRREDELSRAGPINYDFLTAVLANILHDGCTVFNEYSLMRELLLPQQPKSYFYLPSTGGLGWALPAAIGAKLEAPERTMIAAVGDGAYMFANPAACHHASHKHNLPILTIVFNNSRWNAVDVTSHLSYPDGHMTRTNKYQLSDLSPSPAFEQYVEASGGYGEQVSSRKELENAIRRGLHAVEQEGRQALINVIGA